MSGQNGVDGQEVDILYERANERVAKAIAFVGSYLIWGLLAGLSVAVLAMGL